MPVLANSRHEAFAQARFTGMPVMEAYRVAGYEGQLPQLASKVSQHPEVKERLIELHNAAATVVAYERLDLVQDLMTIIKAKPSEAAAEHPLCEVRMGRQGEYHRFPSKLRALARLVKIMGWDEPPEDDDTEQEQPRDTLKEALHRIRTQGDKPKAFDPDAADEWDGSKGVADPNQPLSPRQETFAQARFSGLGVMDAYRAAGYLGDANRASRVSRHPAVKARLAALRKAAEDAMPYRKHEAVNDLIAIIRASPAEACEDHPRCEMRSGHEKPYYRFPCKLAAMLLLVRIMRWQKPEKPKWQAPQRDTLAEFYERIRRRA